LAVTEKMNGGGWGKGRVGKGRKYGVNITKGHTWKTNQPPPDFQEDRRPPEGKIGEVRCLPG